MNRRNGAPPPDGRMYLRTLGELALYGVDERTDPLLSGVKPLAVPAVLATLPRHRSDRAHLAELIWGSNGQAKKARGSLRQALHHLGLHGEGSGVHADEEQVWLDTSEVRVDFVDFEEAVRRGDYGEVIRCYRGPFLRPLERSVGAELQRWIEAQNDRLLIGLEISYKKVVEDLLEEGALAEALRTAQRYADANPLSERAQLMLIRTLHTAGQSPRALEVFEGFRSLLRSELDGELDAQARSALDRVREAAEASEPGRVVYVEGSRAPGEAARSPWRGELGPLLAWTGATAAITAFAVWSVMSSARPAAPAGALPPPQGPWADVSGAVGIFQNGITRDLRIEGTVAVLDTTDFRRGSELRLPDSLHVIGRVSTPRGHELTLAGMDGTPARTVTALSTDVYLHALSPDGRAALLTAGELRADGQTYWAVPYVLSLETGRVTRLYEGNAGQVGGAWSPLGTEIALNVGLPLPSAVVLMNPDGSGLRRVTADSLQAQYPSWSPSGQALAFQYRDGADSWGVATILRDGTGFRPIGDARLNLKWPVWLSDDVLVVLAADRDSSRVLMVRPSSGQLVQVYSGDPGIQVWAPSYPRTESWTEAVRLSPRPHLVSPGQHVHFDVSSWDGLGQQRRWRPGVLGPTSHAPELLRLDDGGSGVVSGLGDIVVTAELPGWRGDTVVVRSVPLRVAPVAVLLTEDWSDSIRADRWTAYGDPLPYTRSTGGREGAGYFVSNGDGSHPSGAVTTRSLDDSGGLTVEAWVHWPYDGTPWQDFEIGIARDASPPADSLDYWGPPWLAILSGNGGWREVWLGYLRFPSHIEPSAWHRVALQISADRVLSAVVDGRLLWRGPWAEALGEGGDRDPVLPTRVRVGLGGQAKGREVKHGTVTVYRGERYVLTPGPAAALPTGR